MDFYAKSAAAARIGLLNLKSLSCPAPCGRRLSQKFFVGLNGCGTFNRLGCSGHQTGQFQHLVRLGRLSLRANRDWAVTGAAQADKKFLNRVGTPHPPVLRRYSCLSKSKCIKPRKHFQGTSALNFTHVAKLPAPPTCNVSCC